MTNKLPAHYENPIDNIILKAIHPIIPWLNRMSLTPNMITTLSLGFSIATSYLICRKQFAYGSICFLVSYILDCMDGQLARRFNMTSEFGDWYDHLTDHLGMILLYGSLYHIRHPYFQHILGASTIFNLVMAIHFSAQQVYSNKKSTFLDILKPIVGTKERAEIILPWSRFFGSGTFIVGISIFLLTQSVSK